MAQRQPFKPTLPVPGDVNPTFDSNVQPRPTTAMNNKDSSHLVATSAPILNLSGLRRTALKKAGVVEREGTPTSPEHSASTSLFFATTPNATNTLIETSRASNLAQRGAPAFAMPAPLNFAAQQSPAFMSANNSPLRTYSRVESARKHAQSDSVISNTASTAACLFPANADTNLLLRPSSAASALHIDRAEFSRFTRHSGNAKMAVNAPVANAPVNQRSWHPRSTSHEYLHPKQPPLHNLSGRDTQEQVTISAEDGNDPESQLAAQPHFTATGKRGLDEDTGHEDDAGVLTSGNHKRQRLYGTSQDSVWHTDLAGTLCILTTHASFARHKKRGYTATKTIILE
jgi:hypothetical protein